MLMNEPIGIRPSIFNLAALRRFSVLAVLAGASSIALRAQQPATPATASAAGPAGTLIADLTNTASAPGSSLAGLAGVSYSSSSDSVEAPAATDAADHLDLPVDPGTGLQPPPRRRYGRPRYNDSSHNPDGSPKYTFEAGVGFTGPIGNSFHYLNTQYAFGLGGGRNFNKNFGVLMQFDYDRFGFNGRTLYNEEELENAYYNCTAYGDCLTSLDGNSHVWSFTLNPVYTLSSQSSVGAYVVGGVGFFHKVANFTTPETGVEYSPFYGYVSVEEQATIDHYSSNAPGVNGGVGLTYKPSRFSGERLYAEARYNLILNEQRTGLTVTNYNTTFGQSYSGTNLYPANSNRTTYLTFKFGIRF